MKARLSRHSRRTKLVAVCLYKTTAHHFYSTSEPQIFMIQGFLGVLAVDPENKESLSSLKPPILQLAAYPYKIIGQAGLYQTL
ncbi:MAG TPA: hypothetical protein VJ917_07305 [Saprospiraceae bacterium]|nr:hypothetical protein [Saprospiraceae bacterium]